MSQRAGVVFDCNVYFQALIGPQGPAGRCLAAARAEFFTLYASEYILGELAEVCLRPTLAARFKLSRAKVETYLASIRATAHLVAGVPHVFDYDRDPDDAHYIDLAVATSSKLVVSRDKDLLALGDPSNPDAQTLSNRFPDLRIITPVAFLTELDRELGATL